MKRISWKEALVISGIVGILMTLAWNITSGISAFCGAAIVNIFMQLKRKKADEKENIKDKAPL